MAHTELDLRERCMIENMLNAKFSISKIAAELGRHRSTVYRNIKRNFYADDELPNLSGYYGVIAQRKAEARCARRRKLIRLAKLRKAVITQLKEGWSPARCAKRRSARLRTPPRGTLTRTNSPIQSNLTKPV